MAETLTNVDMTSWAREIVRERVARWQASGRDLCSNDSGVLWAESLRRKLGVSPAKFANDVANEPALRATFHRAVADAIVEEVTRLAATAAPRADCDVTAALIGLIATTGTFNIAAINALAAVRQRAVA